MSETRDTPRAPSHADLVKVAAGWLRRVGRCGVVLTEHHGGTVEIPDAIGWRNWWSIQVECKVSRADFQRDAHKPGRRHDSRNGEYRQAAERWYLTPAGLLAIDCIPGDWGLLEYDGRRVHVRKPAGKPEKTMQVCDAEVTRLYLEVRRYQAQGLKYLTVKELFAREKAERAARRAAAAQPEPAADTEGTAND